MNADEIEALVNQGRKIFPVTFKAKNPALSGWQEYALNPDTDELLTDLLTRHHRANGDINLGMLVGAHSDVLTIDLDFKHPEAEKFWIKWEGTLMMGTVVNTGNGKHCHFKHPTPGSKVVSSIGGISKGVDLLCDTREDGARYVLIPTSTHPSGAKYEYDPDNIFGTTLTQDLPELPQELHTLIFDRSSWEGHSSETQNTTEVVNHAEWYAENPHTLFNVDPFDDEMIPEGNRNNDMSRIAGKLLYMNEDNHNYLLEDLKSDVVDINTERCDPPLEQAELDLMCESIYKTKTKRDAKRAKLNPKEVKLNFGPIEEDEAESIKVPGAAFGAGVLPEPDEKPIVKEDVNGSALWILHQEPFAPTKSTGTHKIIYLEDSFYQLFSNVWKPVTERSISSVIQSFYCMATKSQVDNMRNFMKNYLYFPIKNIPFWRGNQVPKGYPADPRKLVPFENGLFDLENYVKTGDMMGSLKPHTDQLFNTVKMTYNLNDQAKCPEWEGFLTSVWGSTNSDRAMALQEWCGHMMLPDVTQQKIAVMHGESRSGKSTIGKILHKLIGKENSTATTLHAMTGEHGTSSLVGKTMAIMFDAHLPQKTNGEKALEVLKSISGGDPQIINRKFHDPYTTLLTSRIVMICNEIPKFNDSGNALINRILPFKFEISFYGREDQELENKLTKELEGIAVWALEGIRKYVTRGFMMTPREATQELQDLKRIMNPISAFVDDCLIMPTADPKDEVAVVLLYQAYIDWADANYINHKYTKDRLLGKVKALCPLVRQIRRNGTVYWTGMKLREEVKEKVSDLF